MPKRSIYGGDEIEYKSILVRIVSGKLPRLFVCIWHKGHTRLFCHSMGGIRSVPWVLVPIGGIGLNDEEMAY